MDSSQCHMVLHYFPGNRDGVKDSYWMPKVRFAKLDEKGRRLERAMKQKEKDIYLQRRVPGILLTVKEMSHGGYHHIERWYQLTEPFSGVNLLIDSPWRMKWILFKVDMTKFADCDLGNRDSAVGSLAFRFKWVWFLVSEANRFRQWFLSPVFNALFTYYRSLVS